MATDSGGPGGGVLQLGLLVQALVSSPVFECFQLTWAKASTSWSCSWVGPEKHHPGDKDFLEM